MATMTATRGETSALNQKVNQVLSDGKPHTFAEIYKAARKFVPDSLALRIYRKHNANYKRLTKEQQLERGRKRCVILSLIFLKYRLKDTDRPLEADGRNMDRVYRRRLRARRS